MEFDLIQVVAITVICYLVGMIVKISPLDDKWIPCIVGLLGAALGVVGMYIMPEFPAHDIMNAIAIGIVSGLAATGAHQFVKQLSGTKGKHETE